MSMTDACKQNYLFNHQSDIFNLKSMTRPEPFYSQKAHRANSTNRTSFNFMDWDDLKFVNPPIKTNKKLNHTRNKPLYQMKHKNFQEKLFSVDDQIKVKADRNQINTFSMGDYEGKEYKIKKQKTSDYKPNLYYKVKRPSHLKMEQIYGEDTIRKKKPAIHRTKTEERSLNMSLNNPRERKLMNLYGMKRKLNLKFDSFSIQRSTNNEYNPEIDSKRNRVNMLRSNIFNDKVKERFNTEINNKNNNNDQIKVKITDKKPKKEKTTLGKKAKYEKNAEKFPGNLDWKNEKVNLLFNSERNEDIMHKDAKQRKLKELYGIEPSLPKGKGGKDIKISERKLIEQATKQTYSNLNQSKIKKLSENVSEIQGNQFVNNTFKYKTQKDFYNSFKTYEIHSKNINEKDIEKAFAEKGIHIYDVKEENLSVMGNKKDSKIVFKIRENKNDKDFDNKIKEVQNDFKNKKKINLKASVQQKKKSGDLIPSSLAWNNATSSLYTKNKPVDKTLQEKTHSKPTFGKNNKPEKMTKIFVNLKYKNDHSKIK